MARESSERRAFKRAVVENFRETFDAMVRATRARREEMQVPHVADPRVYVTPGACWYCGKDEGTCDCVQRTNCAQAGEPGHRFCGWCKEHAKPNFDPHGCWRDAMRVAMMESSEAAS